MKIQASYGSRFGLFRNLAFSHLGLKQLEAIVDFLETQMIEMMAEEFETFRVYWKIYYGMRGLDSTLLRTEEGETKT